MTDVIDAIRAEFLRYKSLAEAAVRQLEEPDLSAAAPGGGNSIAVLCWHISGNLRSRFTDFLTADGEKPWRHRDEEFAARAVTRSEVLAKWEQGWDALLQALAALSDEQLGATVAIRRQPFAVREALLRSLAHTAMHVGQIVYRAKILRGPAWTTLSIPPGKSDEYNVNPRNERAAAHAQALEARSRP